MYADLHVHTMASDGQFRPSQVVSMAREKGLGCIAISDHDDTGGIGEALESGRELGVEIIPGVELSTISKDGGRELHMLGYFIRWDDESLTNRLAEFASSREERAGKMVQKLRELGYDIEVSRVEQLADGGVIARPHIAQALVEKGYISSVEKAFTDDLIGKGSRAYVERLKISPEEGVDLIGEYGGVAAIAHPGFLPGGKMLEDDDVIPLVERGIGAIEVHSPKHSPEQIERYRLMAEKYGLVVTGGSDFHGEDVVPGVSLGSAGCGEEVVSALKDRSS